MFSKAANENLVQKEMWVAERNVRAWTSSWRTSNINWLSQQLGSQMKRPSLIPQIRANHKTCTEDKKHLELSSF